MLKLIKVHKSINDLPPSSSIANWIILFILLSLNFFSVVFLHSKCINHCLCILKKYRIFDSVISGWYWYDIGPIMWTKSRHYQTEKTIIENLISNHKSSIIRISIKFIMVFKWFAIVFKVIRIRRLFLLQIFVNVANITMKFRLDSFINKKKFQGLNRKNNVSRKKERKEAPAFPRMVFIVFVFASSICGLITEKNAKYLDWMRKIWKRIAKALTDKLCVSVGWFSK